MSVVLHFDAGPALRQQLESEGIVVCPESDDAALSRALPAVEALWHVLKPVTAEVIARAPRLRLIQKLGVGVNTIDLEAAKARGIAVCNMPGTNSRAVAEMTLALMLACLRRLPVLDASVRRGDWFGAWALQESFGEVGGRTVGLLGYGAVPRLLHPVLEAMGARVLYWSRSQRNAGMDELLAASDIVSLHLPLSAETAGVLDPFRMKRGAILVNTARGGLVDPARLREALESGHLAGAGLDVFHAEPVAAGDALLALSNVVAAPHVAWLTPETLARSLAVARENVARLRRGDALLHRVA